MSKKSKSVLKKCVVIMLLVVIACVLVYASFYFGLITSDVANFIYPIITTGGSSIAVIMGLYTMTKKDSDEK
jgi:hypothetical protein